MVNTPPPFDTLGLLEHPAVPGGEPRKKPAYWAFQAYIVGSDGDGVPDSLDNCPNWYNPVQNLPPWLVPANDPDCDGLTTASEVFAGTNPNLACGVNAWPVDNNDDQKVTLADVLRYIPVFSSPVPNPNYQARYDLNADSKVTLADVLTFIPFFNQSCTQ